MITHHDKRAAYALQRLLNGSRIIQVTLHNLGHTGTEPSSGGVSAQGSKRYISSCQRLRGCGTDAPVNKIMFPPHCSQGLFHVTALKLCRCGADQ